MVTIYIFLITIAIFVSDYVFKSDLKFSKEMERKVGHVGFGLIALSAPFAFTNKFDFILIVVYLFIWFVIIRLSKYFRGGLYDVIHLKSRKTSGDILFVVSVMFLWLLMSNSMLYIACVATITLADSSASIFGKLSPVIKYRVFGSSKSIGGSVVFLVVTLIILSICNQSLNYQLYKIIFAAILATFAEAFSGYGLDNATIPLALLVFLH